MPISSLKLVTPGKERSAWPRRPSGSTTSAPALVPVAAVGVALLLTGAAIMRLRRTWAWAGAAFYAAVAVFVAVGRSGPEPFTG